MEKIDFLCGNINLDGRDYVRSSFGQNINIVFLNTNKFK